MRNTAAWQNITADEITSGISDDEETAVLPALAMPAELQCEAEILKDISARLDELIALGRSIDANLGRLAKAADSPSSAPKTQRKTAKISR